VCDNPNCPMKCVSPPNLCQVQWTRHPAHREPFTYETGGLDVQVGDVVELPSPFTPGETIHGTVTELGSTYKGICRQIIRVVNRPEKPCER
jgi:hypothetical protein